MVGLKKKGNKRSELVSKGMRDGPVRRSAKRRLETCLSFSPLPFHSPYRWSLSRGMMGHQVLNVTFNLCPWLYNSHLCLPLPPSGSTGKVCMIVSGRFFLPYGRQFLYPRDVTRTSRPQAWPMSSPVVGGKAEGFF